MTKINEVGKASAAELIARDRTTFTILGCMSWIVGRSPWPPYLPFWCAPFPPDTGLCPSAVSMFGQRRRRCPNIKTPLGQRLVFPGKAHLPQPHLVAWRRDRRGHRDLIIGDVRLGNGRGRQIQINSVENFMQQSGQWRSLQFKTVSVTNPRNARLARNVTGC